MFFKVLKFSRSFNKNIENFVFVTWPCKASITYTYTLTWIICALLMVHWDRYSYYRRISKVEAPVTIPYLGRYIREGVNFGRDPTVFTRKQSECERSNATAIYINESEIDLHECEHFLKATWMDLRSIQVESTLVWMAPKNGNATLPDLQAVSYSSCLVSTKYLFASLTKWSHFGEIGFWLIPVLADFSETEKKKARTSLFIYL